MSSKNKRNKKYDQAKYLKRLRKEESGQDSRGNVPERRRKRKRTNDYLQELEENDDE